MRALADHIAIVTGAGSAASARRSPSGWRGDGYRGAGQRSACSTGPRRWPPTMRAAGGRAAAVGGRCLRRRGGCRARSSPPGAPRSATARCWSTMPAIVHQSLFEDAGGRPISTGCSRCMCAAPSCEPRRPAGDAGGRRRASIVNIASQLGQIGGVELVHYSAAKAGDHRPDQVAGARGQRPRRAGQCGGARADRDAAGARACPRIGGRRRRRELPLGRFGEPEDVAETVAFLASPAAAIYSSARRWGPIPAT